MLNVKENVSKLEELRIISYSENSYDNQTTYSLDKFSKIQRKNRQKIKDIIVSSSSRCR